MKKLFTLLVLTISFSMNAQMDDNSSNNNQAEIDELKEMVQALASRD